MSFSDPDEILVRDSCFTSETSLENQVQSQVDIHVATCKYASVELEDSSQKGVACSWERLEADLIAEDVLVFEETESFALLCPLQLLIPFKIFAQEKFFEPLEVHSWNIRTGSHSHSLINRVALEDLNESVREQLKLSWVILCTLKGWVECEAHILNVRQHLIITEAVLQADEEVELGEHRDPGVPMGNDVDQVGWPSKGRLSATQGCKAGASVAPDTGPRVVANLLLRDLTSESLLHHLGVRL